MNKKNSSSRFPSAWVALAALALGAALAVWLLARSKTTDTIDSGSSAADSAARSTATTPQGSSGPQSNSAPATDRESNVTRWSSVDGKDTNVIRQLAHNAIEYQRLLDENSRIFRRQLVYHKETAAALIERAKLTGEPLRQLILPGLDGQELQFEIARSDLNPSGQQGTFSGRLAGRADSMVTFAFKGGREAFTILSPTDGLYLVGEPHEPGEIIVKSIDPNTYVVGVCGNP